jgi:hypothetical protein
MSTGAKIGRKAPLSRPIFAPALIALLKLRDFNCFILNALQHY